MAYFGDPVLASQLLFSPTHSLIDQSLHSQMGATTTNGDGFGIGWYGEGPTPAVFKSTEPAWNDANLHEISAQIRTGVLFAHVRAATGTPVQRSNSHPFRHENWLWMHNGAVRGFSEIKRELTMAVDPALYPEIEGSTDSETMFYLPLTFGLVDDPYGAVARMAGHVEAVGRAHGIEHPLQMTVATTNGEATWVFRYSSERATRTLFLSTAVSALRRLHPELVILNDLGDETRLVVSEPLRDLPGAWNELPESSAAYIGVGRDEVRLFRPVPA